MEEWVNKEIKDKKEIPNAAGVYMIKILRSEGVDTILYVGRSINLGMRVRSHYPFFKILLSSISTDEKVVFSYHLTEGWKEMEISLIKKHRPEYNRMYLNRPNTYWMYKTRNI